NTKLINTYTDDLNKSNKELVDFKTKYDASPPTQQKALRPRLALMRKSITRKKQSIRTIESLTRKLTTAKQRMDKTPGVGNQQKSTTGNVNVAASNCRSKDIIINDKILTDFVKFNQDKRLEYINSSFLAGDNMDCLADAKQKVIQLLQNVWTNSKKNADDETHVNNLRKLWENSLTSSGMDTYKDLATGRSGVFNIGLQDITGKPSQPNVLPKTPEELMADLNKLKEVCGSIPPVSASGNLTNIPILIKDIKQSVATTWNTLTKFKQFKQFNITRNGDCLYEAIVTGMFNKGIGEYKNAIGWIPEKKGEGVPGLPNYMGNLRNVLAKYICANIDNEEFIKNFGTVELTSTIGRILSTNISKTSQSSPNSGWGEDTELKLMARLFNICIAVYRGDLDIIQYINNYGDVMQDPSDVPNMCGENLIYIINKDGISHYDLLIPDTDGPSKMSAESKSTKSPQEQSAETLKSEPNCDISKYDSTVPTDREEAEQKYNTLSAIQLDTTCSERDQHNLMTLEFEYVDNFNEKFGTNPRNYNISPKCTELFTGEYDFRVVPDNKELAVDKVLSFLSLPNEDGICDGSIRYAMDQYMDKLELTHPGAFNDSIEKDLSDAGSDTGSDTTTITTTTGSDAVSNTGSDTGSNTGPDPGSPTPTSSDAGSVNDCDKLFEGDMNFNFIPDDIQIALNKYYSLTKIKIDDKSKNGGKCSQSILNALKVYTDQFILKFPEILTTPFTEIELTNMYNMFTEAGKKPMNNKVINSIMTDKFLLGIRMRKLFGFPDIISQADISETNSETGKIFSKIVNTSTITDRANVSLPHFIDFIYCGTHRDKNNPDVNCKNVTSSDGSSPSPSSTSPSPSSTSPSPSSSSSSPGGPSPDGPSPDGPSPDGPSPSAPSPYTPPLKDERVIQSNDIRGGIPININTRAVDTNYRQVGILKRMNGPEMVLALMGRPLYVGRDKWQYYTMSDNNNSIKLPVSFKSRSCTNEYGCDEITNGDTVYVDGIDATFQVTVYDNATMRYIPFI
ncbi:hypothetical protein N8261_06370, partial [Flavobacteriaceae bacterium]|nr:hypothetical protein [Flavobacteriaceae bacterium]